MKVISEADVVLALGTRLGPFGSLPQYGFDYWPKDAKIIQVDIAPRRLGLTKGELSMIYMDEYLELFVHIIKNHTSSFKIMQEKNKNKFKKVRKHEICFCCCHIRQSSDIVRRPQSLKTSHTFFLIT